MFIWGGELAKGDTSHLKNVYILDTLKEEWKSTSITGDHPPGYRNCFSAQSGNILYVYGGDDEQGKNTGSLFSLNLDVLSWRELSPDVHNGPSKKIFGGMVAHGDKIILFGGLTEDKKITNELHVLDLSTGMNCKDY